MDSGLVWSVSLVTTVFIIIVVKIFCRLTWLQFLGNLSFHLVFAIFESIFDLTVVLDADECRINHGGCEFSCNNTESSYYCSCRSGHILAADKHSCLDIDECQSLTHQCPGKKIFLIITDSLKNSISGWNIDYQKVDDKVFFKLHGRGIKSCQGYPRFGHFLFCFRSL